MVKKYRYMLQIIISLLQHVVRENSTADMTLTVCSTLLSQDRIIKNFDRF